MPDLHEDRSRRAAVTGRWVERALVAGGAAALVLYGVFVADRLIAQRHAREAVRSAMTSERPLIAPALEDVAEPAPAGPPPDTGAAIGTLSIPRIGLSAAVLHGSDAKTLRRAPGHLEQTAYPGEAGNAVIAGHRDTFFRPLRNIRVGDDIFVAAAGGRFHYRVVSLRVVHPRDLSVLAPTSDATLTLVTCYPFWALGPAPDRFIVRATRVDAPSPPPLEARTRPALPSPEAAGLPDPEPAAAVESVEPDDDESRIRLVVGRYLRLHGAPPTCEVAIGDDRATADCHPGRTFTLERSGSAWAIRSIVVTR